MRRSAKLLRLLPLAAVFLIVSTAAAGIISPRAIRVPAAKPIRARIPSHLLFTAFQPFQSTWASPAPQINGVATNAEWGSAPRLNFANGQLRIQNDLGRLYLLLDVTGDTTNDPLQPDTPWGDYFWLAWDVNGDRNVTADVDLLHGIYPGTSTVGLCHFIEPGAVTPLEPSGASLARGFGATPGSPTPHRFWEMSIPLEEIGADAYRWVANPEDAHPLRLGFHVHSEVPLISDYVPQDLLQDFARCTRILLALSPNLSGVGGSSPPSASSPAPRSTTATPPPIPATPSTLWTPPSAAVSTSSATSTASGREGPSTNRSSPAAPAPAPTPRSGSPGPTTAGRQTSLSSGR